MSNIREFAGMSDSPLMLKLDGAIATLTLNRPDAGNAITLELARQLVAAAIRCDTDPAIRCVVLTGTGRLFCAGGDIGVLSSGGAQSAAVLSELAGTLHMAISRLARMPKPLLVLVNGPAAGAGLGLAVLGDVVLATASAHFTAAYTAIGMTPDGGTSWQLPRLIGLRKAQEMILTNRRVSAAEAETMGLITRAIDDSKFAAEGAAMAQRLAQSATRAVGAARALLIASFGADLESHLELEARTISAASAGAESREGIAAFKEKRKADFGSVRIDNPNPSDTA
jgi:2-(1,2-epoxy-1,2-dihydrophenyl)acetyl-CoA isomerase